MKRKTAFKSFFGGFRGLFRSKKSPQPKSFPRRRKNFNTYFCLFKKTCAFCVLAAKSENPALPACS